MKKLIALLTLIALPAIAGTNYIAFVYAETLKHPDKTLEKTESKELFMDSSEVQWADMARFCSVADTSVLYRVVCYAIDVGTVKKNITKDECKTKIKDKLSEKTKCTIVACGERPLVDLLAAGFKPVQPEVAP